MPYSSTGFQLEPFAPTVATPPMTYSQSPNPSVGSFSAPSFSAGGGGGGSSQRAFAMPMPGSAGRSFSQAGGMPHRGSAGSPYGWGVELGRQFARKRWQDALEQAGRRRNPYV